MAEEKKSPVTAEDICHIAGDIVLMLKDKGLTIPEGQAALCTALGVTTAYALGEGRSLHDTLNLTADTYITTLKLITKPGKETPAGGVH